MEEGRGDVVHYLLMNPLIKALQNLGGSATIEEMSNEVAEIMHLSDEQVEQLHDPDRQHVFEP